MMSLRLHTKVEGATTLGALASVTQPRITMSLSSAAARVSVVSTLGYISFLAGPPLLCHPFDIGSAASLPWNGTSSWFDGKPDYRLSGLVSDTEALLVPSTPVVVRMETLRRAAIYASRDPQVASALLERLAANLIESGLALTAWNTGG